MRVHISGLYSLQLYTDFLSCTTLAQGASELFGIEIIDNFHHPYFAVSVQDFWRRWHISLSTWLKDYVYIPLGGSRAGKLRKYINLFITFLISGFWHGEGVKFIFWGLLHAVYQIVGSITRSYDRHLFLGNARMDHIQGGGTARRTSYDPVHVHGL